MADSLTVPTNDNLAVPSIMNPPAQTPANDTALPKVSAATVVPPEPLTEDVLFDQAVQETINTAPRKPTMQASVANAVSTNPDFEAEARRVALRTGVPVQTVFAEPEKMKQKAALADIDFDAYQKLYPTSAAVLANVDMAKLAHDDTNNMGSVENVLRGIGARAVNLTGGFFRTMGTVQTSATDAIIRQVMPDELLANPNVSAFLDFKKAVEQQTVNSVASPLQKFDLGFTPETTWQDVKDRPLSEILPFAIEQGLVSAPDMAAAVANPAGYFGALLGEMGQNRAENDERPAATIGDFVAVAPAAAVNALLERFATKGIIGIEEAALTSLKQVPKAVGVAALKEGTTEAFQNSAQYVSETVGTKKGDFNFPTMGELALQGAVAGGPFGGAVRATAEVPSLVKSAVNISRKKMQTAGQAEQNAADFEQLNALAAESKLRPRDPLAFQNFIDQVSQTDGAIEDVYINPKDLAQSGISLEEIAAVSPVFADQYREALETGADVKIPVSEYATHLAGTDLGQAMVDHLKTDPLAMSRAESQEFMQNNAEELKADVEKALAEKEGDDVFQQSAEVVKEDLTAKLAKANRFTKDVNDQYAAMLTSFFKVNAAKEGLTPEEFYKKYPLNINAVLDSGFLLNQSENLPRNDLGLYSAVEKEVGVTNLPSWKPNPKKQLSAEDSAKLEELRAANIQSTADERYQEFEQLRQKEREAQGLASGKEIWQKIKSLPVKQEELEWLGVEDFLLSSTEKLTRQDVIDFIRQNGVQVEEVVGDQEGGDFQGFDWDQEEWAEANDVRVNNRVEDSLYEYDNGDDDAGYGDQAIDALVEEESSYIEQALGEDASEDAKIEYVRENFADQIRNKVEEFARESVQEEVDSDPLMRWYDRERDVEITGNDDYGYSINGEFNEIYSFAEAELQVTEMLRDRGELGDDSAPNTARWGDYVMAGPQENYRELKLTLPNIEDDFMNNTHFEDRNVLAFLRVDDRDFYISPELDKAAAELPNELPDDAVVAGYKLISELRRDVARFEDIIKETEVEGRAALFRYLPENVSREKAAELLDSPNNDDLLLEQIDNTTEQYKDAGTYDDAKKNDRIEAGGYVNHLNDLKIRKKRLARLEEEWNSAPDMRRNYAIRRAPSSYRSKAYFIDEFQSDWHQHGRQDGYKTGKVDADRLRSELTDLSRTVRNKALDDIFEGTMPEGSSIDIVESVGGTKTYYTPTLNTVGSTPFDTLEQARFRLADMVLERDPAVQELEKQLAAERNGVPDAPFKGDAWLSLGMKRAVIDAVEKDYDMLAWVDAKVVGDRWSSRYAELYINQYDRKMPSIVEKLTKQKPKKGETENGDGYWYVQLTPELKEKIRKEAFPLFQGDKMDARGSFNPATNTITLLKSADLSTFLHESGHFFLETMNKMALDPNAPEQVKADMQDTLTWLGVKDLAEWNSHDLEWQREKHEQFARGFEAYLFEGKSPSIEMRSVFQRFRAWLLNVYKNLKALNVELSPEIRSVFDRMLATTEQIKEAELARGFEPMFKDATTAGMSETEWLAYQELGLQSTQDAIEELETRGLRDMKWLSNAKSRAIKDLQRQADGRRREVRNAVTKEVMSEPVNQARRFITKGEIDIPEGAPRELRRFATEAALTGGTKLSLPALKEMYGNGPNAVWRYFSTGKNGEVGKEGAHPDVIAQTFGFNSGDELVRELLSSEKPKEKIAALTDQRMLEKYGDLTNPDVIARAADEAIHNEARSKFVATELNALQKATGAKKILASAAKEYAAKIIDNLKVRELSPSKYIAGESRAARAAEKALRAGKLAEAAVEKRNQLIQNYATRAAQDAQREVEKAVQYFKGFDRAGTRKNIDTAYLDQIDALLERFDLRKSQSLKAIDKRASLTAWVESQAELGIEPDIPAELLTEAARKHFKDMTVEEVRGLRDTIKQIDHLGKLKNRLLTAKDNRDFKTTVEGLVASIKENANGRVVDNRTRANWGGRKMEMFKGFIAEHRKIASLARELDGIKDGGPMWETFIRSMNTAGNMEASMRAKATKELAVLVKPLLDGGKMGGKGVMFPTIGKSLNREERIGMALNMGNKGNMQRLLDGEGWTLDQIRPVLDTLTQAEWDFAQNIWDFFETYRPLIGAKEKRVYGKEPKWVEPNPVQTQFGEYRGGYYPIKYDTRRSLAAEQFNDADAAKQMLKGAFTSATTRRSFTKERADAVKNRPLLYTMDGLYNGVNEVIHDLSWHEWLIDANRLLRSKSLDSAIRNGFGADVIKQFKTAVQDIAGGEMPTGTKWEKGLADLRAGVVVAGLGFNIVNSVINVTGLSNSIVRIGPKWVGIGVARFSQNPRALTAEVHEKSEFMRNRSRTLLREINEIQSRVRGKSSAREKMDTIMFLPLTMTQIAVDVPTWYGAYQKAVSSGETEERSIALADQAVVDAQSGGQIKDLAAVQRGSPILKLFTTFYGYFNAVYNLTVERTKATDFKDPMSILKLGADYLILYTVPVVMGRLIMTALSGGEDDWDVEKLAKNMANDHISYLMGTMVGLRETTGAIQTFAGVNPYANGYGGPAGLRFFSEFYKLASQTNQGEVDEAFRKSAVNTAGIVFKLPAAQINRTLSGTDALIEGETSNPAAIIAGPPPPK